MPLLMKLLRPLAVLFLIGLICHFFYALGKRKALGNKDRSSRGGRRPRKFVQCKVVEDDEDPKNEGIQKD